jgi:chromate transporter
VVGVVLNLALWFALHVVFREVRSFDLFGVGPDLPVLGSIDWRAAVLAAAAMVGDAEVQGRDDPTLAACALAGVVLGQLPA